jgi:alkylhydroperoxidase family enzyme
MAWIHLPRDKETPELTRVTQPYRTSGRPVPAVVAVMKPSPKTLLSVLQMNFAVTFGGSSLGRLRKETITTAVIAWNDCFYLTVSHAGLLRDAQEESLEDVVAFVQRMLRAGRESALLPLEEGVSSLQNALLGLQETVSIFTPQDIAMLNFAVQTAWAPRKNQATHTEPLREAGFSDIETHDFTHVTCCFSYMNRLADSLGVTTDVTVQEWAETLYGAGSFQKHLQWAKRAQ